MTAKERWIEERDGKAFLIEELDGWSFIHAKRRGEEVREERELNLSTDRDRAVYEKYRGKV
jgi:hypothetical protein